MTTAKSAANMATTEAAADVTATEAATPVATPASATAMAAEGHGARRNGDGSECDRGDERDGDPAQFGRHDTSSWLDLG